MVNALFQLSTQQPGALKVIGPIGIVVGLFQFFGAIFDPAKYVTRWYEANEGSKMGFFAVSNSPKVFRFWCALSGLFATALSIAMVLIVY
jgi:hypothetical protein